VLKKVGSLGLLKDLRTVGVVGGGALGSALAGHLKREHRIRVCLYDKRSVVCPDGVELCRDLRSLLLASDVVFGCTGHNFLRPHRLENLAATKSIYFISCSSRDVEFKSLLQLPDIPENPHGRITIRLPSGQTHYIENGGFPINFDRQEEQESAEEIALTRALVFAGVFQAVRMKQMRSYPDVLMLPTR
jgi:hypothetical protein